MHEETEKQVVQNLDDMAQMQELIKDFNQFESLYRAQQELAAQTAGLQPAGQLSREDQLALKDLAATEKQVADVLGRLQDKLRDDAKAAEKLFPKAAQSGRDLADKSSERRLHPLAEQATSQMLAGNGDQSFNLADRLRGEMEKMFGECQGGNCPSRDELDSLFAIAAHESRQQFRPDVAQPEISASARAAAGQRQGEGAMGTSGYAVMDGRAMNVMGNESIRPTAAVLLAQSSRFGKGAGGLAGARPGRRGQIRRDERPQSGQPPVRRRVLRVHHRGIQRRGGKLFQGDHHQKPTASKMKKSFKNSCAVLNCYPSNSSRAARIWERGCVRSTSRSTLEAPKALRLGLRPQPRSIGCGYAALYVLLLLAGSVSRTAAEPPGPAPGFALTSVSNHAAAVPALPGVAVRPDLTLLQCGNLIYNGNKSSVCFADRFLTDVAQQTNLRVNKKFCPVRLDAEALFDYPFCVMSGNENFSLNEKERWQLRKFLTQGGFLLASPGCSDEKWDNPSGRKSRSASRNIRSIKSHDPSGFFNGEPDFAA